MALERSRRLGSGRGTAWVDSCCGQRHAGRRGERLRLGATDLIRPGTDRMILAGTDGFGRSDTRANLRRFFRGRSSRDRVGRGVIRRSFAGEPGAFGPST